MGTRRFDDVLSDEAVRGRDQRYGDATCFLGQVSRGLRGTVEGHVVRLGANEHRGSDSLQQCYHGQHLDSAIHDHSRRLRGRADGTVERLRPVTPAEHPLDVHILRKPSKGADGDDWRRCASVRSR